MKNIVQTITDVQQGKFVVVIDDKSPAKTGYLLIAAEKITPDALSFLSRNTTEKTSLSLSREIMDRLEIHGNASVDYRHQRRGGGTSAEKYRTIRAMISSEVQAADFKKSGHVFPISYSKGGVLTHPRAGEAGIDLARLAGQYEAAVFGEIANDKGVLASMEEALMMAKKEQLTTITISDLVDYRWNHEVLVKEISRARLPTEDGEYTMILFGSVVDDIEHIVLVQGQFTESEEVLVRIQSECITGEIFGSRRCDCKGQLHGAMQMINNAGKGVLIYLRGQEGRGIGLAHKLQAYNLQDQGQDTVEANLSMGLPADKRNYGIGAQILKFLGVKKIKLLTNNPKKTSALQTFGFEIAQRVPLVYMTADNEKYMRAKKSKLGHIIEEM